MSFYGSTYFQLIDTFYKIAIKNSGKDNKSFYTGTLDDYVSQAVGRKGAVQFSTGNRWIQISKDGDNQYSFWHNSPEANGTSVQAFAPNITLPQGVDEATVEELTPGNFVEVRTIKYDAAGHVSGSAPSYYKIPISETEKDIEDLKEAVGVPRDGNTEATGLYKDIDDINEELEGTTNLAKKLRDELGSYYNIFPDTGTTYYDTNEGEVLEKDFYAAIGSMDLFRTKIYDDSGSSKSLVDGIVKMKEDLTKNVEQNSANIAVQSIAIKSVEDNTNALSATVQQLISRIEALEKG